MIDFRSGGGQKDLVALLNEFWLLAFALELGVELVIEEELPRFQTVIARDLGKRFAAFYDNDFRVLGHARNPMQRLDTKFPESILTRLVKPDFVNG